MIDPHEREALCRLIRSGHPERLSPHEVDRLLRHADECAACAAAMREFAGRAILAQTPELRLAPASALRIRRRFLGAARGAAATAPRSDLRAAREGGGWLAATALAVALVTHHGFHEPLRSGWLAAGVFAASTLALGIYALAQRARVSRLERTPRSGGHAAESDQAAR